MTWIFGYGSLIWRPGFPYLKRARATLFGYERRFWQGSPDHRGTPAEPGRVVTLVPLDDGRCEGVAFLIDERRQDEILKALDIRESGGYQRVVRSVIFGDGLKAEAIVYLADEDNPSYLGPAPIDVMARHIAMSSGPSGRNIDYVLNLKDILDEEGIHDPHLNALVECLQG